MAGLRLAHPRADSSMAATRWFRERSASAWCLGANLRRHARPRRATSTRRRAPESGCGVGCGEGGWGEGWGEGCGEGCGVGCGEGCGGGCGEGCGVGCGEG